MFDVKQSVHKYSSEVAKWRHQIHMNPELAFNEEKTSAMVETVLREAGIEVVRFPNSTAVLGILRGGKPGKVIALRADMDALPLQELVDVKFKSQVPGVMHACGHDMHTAILMGVAKILAENKEHIPGTVKLFFQPAEEFPPGGAKDMVAAGVMENPKVDHVFGLHVSNTIPAGEIGITYGYSSANSDKATITIIGKGGHGANPQNTVDSIVVASHVVVALQSIVSRNIGALDAGVVTVGSFHAGTVNNIIAETTELQLTIRSLTDEVRHLLKERIKATVNGTAEAMGARAEVDYSFGYPSLFNDDSAVNIVKRVGELVVGSDKIEIKTTASMGGEDFAYFAKEAPSAFLRLGARPEGEEEVYPAHNPKFKINEDCIETGLEMMVRIVLEASK